MKKNYSYDKVNLIFKRIKANAFYFLELAVICVVCVLLLFCFADKKEGFAGYINTVVVGAMGSVVASILFLMLDRQSRFNRDCRCIAKEITRLLDEIKYLDFQNMDSQDKKIYVKDIKPYISNFMSVYEYVYRVSSNYRFTSHITTISILLSDIIKLLKTEDDDCEIHEHIEKLYSKIGTI